MLCTIILLAVLQSIISPLIHAQNLPFRTYSVEHGLAGAEVLAICQDSSGYLWFGTGSGLSKFDGVEFTNYTTADGLAGDVVRALMVDHSGNLWIGSVDGGVTKFDGATFTAYDTDDGLGWNGVRAILEDRDGILWFGTIGGGVTQFDGLTMTTLTMADGLVGNYVTSLSEDFDGTIWIGTNQGLSSYDGERFTRHTFLSKNGSDNSVQLKVAAMLQDNSGILWIAGVGLTKYQDDALVPITGKSGLLAANFRAVASDHAGNLWFGTDSQGILKYDGTLFTAYTIRNGLPLNTIASLLVDREGNLWVGTDGAGVSMLRGEAFIAYTTDHGLPDENVRDLLEDSKGRLWVATQQGGISRLTENGFTAPLPSSQGSFYLLEDHNRNLWTIRGANAIQYDGDTINSIKITNGPHRMRWFIEDSKHRFWFSTSNGGLYLYDGHTTTQFDTSNGLAANHVDKIFEDAVGNIWVGTEYGLSMYDGVKMSTYTREDGLAGSWVLDMFQDSQERLWFVIEDAQGVSMHDGRQLRTYTMADGLASNQVIPLMEDNRGNIWFVTAGGVSQFDGARFTNYEMDHAFFSRRFRFLMQAGNIAYYGTNNGIFRFDPTSISLTELSTKDGLSSSVMNLYAVTEDRHGNLWFGTRNGVTRLNPALYATNPIPPPVYISHFQINGRDTTLHHDLALPYNQNHVRFDFTGLCFTDPEAILYHYRLDGHDAEWIPTKSRWVSYTYLPTGSYTFRVKARNNDGVWSTDTARVSFVIAPPFWDTTWFRSCLGLVFLSSLVGIFRMGQIVRRKQVLESAVLARTEELVKQTESLRKKSIYVQLHQRIAAAANEAADIEEALKTCLEEICNLLAWPVGHVYLLSREEPDLLEPTTLWHLEKGRDYREFQAVTERTQFRMGEGLPGRIWESGDPAWISNVQDDLNFSRSTLCRELHLRSAFGFPVIFKSELVAVLEFFCTETIIPDEQLLEVMGHVGAQLSPVIERQRAAAEMRRVEDEHRTRLEQQVADRTEELHNSLAVTETAHSRIDAILKSIADGLIVSDLNHRIILLNRTAEDMLKVHFSELVGKTIEQAFKNSILGDHIMVAFRSTGRNDQFDIELDGTNGENPRILRGRTSPILDRSGKELGIIAILQDVTHEREVDRMKTDFISTAAHELRTPLTSIQGFSEILLTRSELDAQDRERFLGYINKQAVGLAVIINDLLDIARIESGRGFSLERSWCDIKTIIREVVDVYQSDSQYNKHTIILNLPDTKVELFVDKEKIVQVLNNLISNALKYSPEGGVITLMGRLQDADFVFSIEDEGLGMTEEQVSHVFEKFYRADASNAGIGGTGLGMTLVKHIVEAHHGMIRIESTLGEGTSVVCTFPLQQNVKPEDTSEAS